MDNVALRDIRDQLAADPAHSNDLMLFDRIISRVEARKASNARREQRAEKERHRQQRELERQTRQAKIAGLEAEAKAQLEQRQKLEAQLAEAKTTHAAAVAALEAKVAAADGAAQQVRNQLADTIERHSRALKQKDTEINDLKKDNARVRADAVKQSTRNERLGNELQAVRAQIAKQAAAETAPMPAAAPAGKSVLNDTVVVKSGPDDVDDDEGEEAEDTDPEAAGG